MCTWLNKMYYFSHSYIIHSDSQRLRNLWGNIIWRSIVAFANREYNLIYTTVTVEYWESKWGFLCYVMAVQTEMLAFTLCPRFIAHTLYSQICIEWKKVPIQIRCSGLHLECFFFHFQVVKWQCPRWLRTSRIKLV